MGNLILNLEDYSQLVNSYQIIQDKDYYKIWISTGPISGFFLKNLDKERSVYKTENLADAISELSTLLRDEEFVL